MTLFDFIDYASTLPLDAVELTSYYWAEPESDEYVTRLKAHAAAKKLAISGVPIRSDFCQKDAARWKKDVEATKAWTLERVYQFREGYRGRPDDTIPKRVLTEPIPDGPNKGVVIDQKKLELMKEEYYEARGFDKQTGLPTAERLEAIGLADVAADLRARGKL